jgi:drug/metabolite transporter (DMT)-like permease
MMLLAGLLMLAGLLRGKHRWSFGLEMTGMILAAVVFATYAAGLGLSISTGGARSVMGCATYSIISLACLVKARALWIESHNRLQLIKELPLPDQQGETDG